MPRSDSGTRRTARVAPDAPVAPSTQEQVERLMARPYHRIVRGDPEEGYLAKVAEFPGCFTAGETPVEAMELLEDAMRAWLVVAIEDGHEIPEPNPEPSDDYSGRFVLRVPKMLHQQLAERAHTEGVSLNTLAVTLLSLALGQRVSAGSASRGGSSVELIAGRLAEDIADRFTAKFKDRFYGVEIVERTIGTGSSAIGPLMELNTSDLCPSFDSVDNAIRMIKAEQLDKSRGPNPWHQYVAPKNMRCVRFLFDNAEEVDQPAEVDDRGLTVKELLTKRGKYLDPER